MKRARTYTATASQGLLFMAEALYNASGLGLPIVMTVANRAIGAPINIWNDHSDAMSQRDCGWVQLYAESNQDAVDLHVQAFRLAEERSLPGMVCVDGFALTHAAVAWWVHETGSGPGLRSRIDASAATAPRESVLADTVTEGLPAGGGPGGKGSGEPAAGSTGEEDPPQDVAQTIANRMRKRARGSIDDTVIVSFAGEEVAAPVRVPAPRFYWATFMPATHRSAERAETAGGGTALPRSSAWASTHGPVGAPERSRFATRLTDAGGRG